MRYASGLAALRQKFSLPIALSVGLHGLAAAALGTFALTPSVKPVPGPTVTVNLVAPAKAKVIRRAPEPLQSPARQAEVKRAAPRAAAMVPARRQTVPAPLVRQAAVVVAHAPVVTAFEPQAAFKDLPRVLAPAAQPAAAHVGTAALALPESTEVPDSLSAGGVANTAFSRPLPIVYGNTRLLRDTTAEAGLVRSQVRSGNNPRPDYPRAAREAGWEGTVTLQVLVLPDGTAGAVTLHKTSGHAVLDEAALSAVKTWRFIPAMDGNFPVQSVVRLPVRFDLKSVD